MEDGEIPQIINMINKKDASAYRQKQGGNDKTRDARKKRLTLGR